MRRYWQAAASATLALAFGSLPARADDVRYYEQGGTTYRETRQTVRHPIVETRMEDRESTVYRDTYSTVLQDTPRTFPVAVTEYHWVPVWRRSWNPFAPPYLTYEMVPQTRWETHSDTVKTSVTQHQVVPEKITYQVPVTTQRYVDSPIVSRVAVSSAPPGATIASSPTSAPAGGSSAPGGSSSDVANRTAIGGVMKLDSDPPRGGNVGSGVGTYNTGPNWR